MVTGHGDYRVEKLKNVYCLFSVSTGHGDYYMAESFCCSFLQTTSIYLSDFSFSGNFLESNINKVCSH